MDFLKRTEMLIGPDAIEKLKSARVAVFGAGGVGCAVIEALARAGIGAIDIIDNDTYSQTNLNRQLFATVDTIFFEALPLSLEEIFISETEVVGYDIKKLILG